MYWLEKNSWNVNQLTFLVVNVNVAMGRAIVRDAQGVCDGRTFDLDAKLRVSMRAEIAKIHRRIQATTIYMLDQTEAMTLADRIVIMSGPKTQLVLVQWTCGTNWFSARSVQTVNKS